MFIYLAGGCAKQCLIYLNILDYTANLHIFLTPSFIESPPVEGNRFISLNDLILRVIYFGIFFSLFSLSILTF